MLEVLKFIVTIYTIGAFMMIFLISIGKITFCRRDNRRRYRSDCI